MRRPLALRGWWWASWLPWVPSCPRTGRHAYPPMEEGGGYCRCGMAVFWEPDGGE